MSGKLLGQTSGEHKIYQGCLRNGELWFAVLKPKGDPLMPEADCLIKRLDLETGIECDTGLVIAGRDFGYPIWMGDELYVETFSAIYRKEGTSLKRVSTNPGRSTSLIVPPFLYQDQLTTVVETNDGGFRLLHLLEDKWAEGRKILLPTPGRVWYHDPQRDRRVLLPLTSEQPVLKRTVVSRLFLQVLWRDGQIHLHLTDDLGFEAYRCGFEFADDSSEIASGFAPVNFAKEVTGWMPIQTERSGDRWKSSWIGMGSDRDGLVFCSWDGSNRVVRRTNDGRWEDVIESGGMRTVRTPHFAQNQTDPINYIIEEDQRWSSVTVRRVEGNTVHPVHLTLPGFRRDYLARWQLLFAGLLIAWLTHLAVLTGGMAYLTLGQSKPHYEFGIQQVSLASIGRRGLALSFEAFLLVTILFASGYVRSWIVDGEWERSTESELSDAFYVVETDFLQGGLIGLERIPSELSKGIFLMVFGHPRNDPSRFSPLPFIVSIGIAPIMLWCLMLYFDGRYGITPGKWLLGIRTMRSTLRPCGFVRALVRDVLYWVDIPLLMTPIPAAISMVFSQHRQRLGDRIADTIVVTASSIKTAHKSGLPQNVA
jgi:uncharacterized RDD family membrane protein YckC